MYLDNIQLSRPHDVSPERRQLLKLLGLAVPAALAGCPETDPFSDEHVCIHIFPHGADIPEPLLSRTGVTLTRKKGVSPLGIGLPELVLGTADCP